MKRILGLASVFVGIAGSLMAQCSHECGAPEIDPGAALTALALLSGGLLVLRARRKT